MKRSRDLLLFLICPLALQAAERPPTCQQSTVPLMYQTPVQDLSGKLPVPDYLDAVLDCSDLAKPGMQQSTPMGPRLSMPDSQWIRDEGRRHADLLTRQKYSWLVLPVQIQYMGVDQAERALISAELASAFADQQPAPDVSLVARALGEVRRRFEPADISRLTRDLGTQHRLDSYVGHDGAHRLTLTVQLSQCAANGQCKLVKQHDWRNVPFSDEEPPFLVVSRLRDEIRRTFLNLRPTAAPAVAQRVAFTNLAPSKVFALPPSPLLDSLFAAFASRHEPSSRGRLHVAALRSWLAQPPSAQRNFYASYSALMLSRRPFALELVREQKDAGAHALRALLNGNYLDASRKASLVRDPVQRLLLEFALQDFAVAIARERPLHDSIAVDVFGNAAPAWSRLIERRINDSSNWLRGDEAEIKRLLDELVPIKGLGIKEVSIGTAVAGRPQPLSLVNLRHLRQAMPLLGDSRSRWQAHSLLENLAQGDVFWAIAQSVDVQGDPETGQARVRQFEGSFAGNPVFETARAAVMGEMSLRASNDDEPQYEQAYQTAEWSAVFWSQGASYVANLLARGTHMLPFIDAYARDFPPRATWAPDAMGLNLGPGPCAALKYAWTSGDRAQACLQTLKGQAAEQLRGELKGRFQLNPVPENLITPAVEPKPAGDELEALLASRRASIKADPEDWENYASLGGLLIQRRGAYAEAQRVYLSYPLFKTRATRRVVELANDAYRAGSELYWQGQSELARPLYEIAASLDTGAASSYSSAARLAQLDGDFQRAAEIFLARGMRYDDSYAYRDYLSLLYVMGYSAEADAAFSQIAESFDGPHAWVSQLVGQRMRGTTPAQFRTWATSPEILNARHRGQRFAGYYAMIAATTDRVPDSDMVKLLEELVRADTRRIDGAFVARPHPDDEKSFALVGSSKLPAARRGFLPNNMSVPHEYVLFSQALALLHSGQHKAANDKFLEYARLYSIEEGNTRTAMAYFAWAAAKSGDPNKLEQHLESLQTWDQDFDVFLSRAFFAAARKDINRAELALKRAFYVRPHTESRPVMTEYQYAEACEIVARETGDSRFIDMLVGWARQNQRIQPTQAWSYAVEAQYSKIPADANRALAIALYLDPRSPRLAGIDEQRKNAARTWLRSNNPFVKKKAPMARPAT